MLKKEAGADARRVTGARDCKPCVLQPGHCTVALSAGRSKGGPLNSLADTTGRTRSGQG